MNRYEDSADRNPGAFYENALLGEQPEFSVMQATLAVAAELRTRNMIELVKLQQTGLTTALNPIKARLGVGE